MAQQYFAGKTYVLLQPFGVGHFFGRFLLYIGKFLLDILKNVSYRIGSHRTMPADVPFARFYVQLNGSNPRTILAAVVLFLH